MTRWFDLVPYHPRIYRLDSIISDRYKNASCMLAFAHSAAPSVFLRRARIRDTACIGKQLATTTKCARLTRPSPMWPGDHRHGLIASSARACGHAPAGCSIASRLALSRRQSTAAAERWWSAATSCAMPARCHCLWHCRRREYTMAAARAKASIQLAFFIPIDIILSNRYIRG